MRWKMHIVWPPPGVVFKWYPFFRSAHLYEHKNQMPALRIACCTFTFDGRLQVLLCSLRLESSNCPERIIVR